MAILGLVWCALAIALLGIWGAGRSMHVVLREGKVGPRADTCPHSAMRGFCRLDRNSKSRGRLAAGVLWYDAVKLAFVPHPVRLRQSLPRRRALQHQWWQPMVHLSIRSKGKIHQSNL
jgi:hypothetical protein